MPRVNTGRANVGQEGKSTGKRRVARIRRRAAPNIAGPPAPKPAPTVAPADRVTERVDARRVQIRKSKSLSPDRMDEKRSPQQQQRDKDVAASNIRTARLKVVTEQGRGTGTQSILHAVQGGLHIVGKGLGNFASAGGQGVSTATSGPQLRTASATGVGAKTTSTIAGRAAQDALNMPAQSVTSAYDVGAGLKEAAQGKPARLKRIAKAVDETDPVFNLGAAAVEKIGGDDKAAKKRLKAALKSANLHPGYAAAEIMGAKGTLGRGAGTVGRSGVLGGKVKQIAGTERAPKVLPGTSITVPREWSRDLTRKSGQVLTHRQSSDPLKDTVSVQDINRRVDERVNVSGQDVPQFVGEFGHKINGKVQLLTPKRAVARAGELEAASGHPFVPIKMGERVALIPEAAVKRLQEHASAKTNTTATKALEVVNDSFRRVVLSTSTSWSLGNLAEGAVRAAVNRAGPRSYITGRKLRTAVRKLDPAKAEELGHRILDGGHYSLAEKLQVQDVAQHFTGTALEPMAKAMHNVLKAPGPKQLNQLWKVWTESVFHGTRKIEQQFQLAHLGAEVRRSSLMSDRLVKLSKAAIDDAAKDLTNTENQVKFARAVQDAYGKYSAWSPSARMIMASYSPFIAWLASAVKFVGYTLPREHPALLALNAAAVNATEEWRKSHGLDLWMKGSVKGYLQGGIPSKDGGIIRASRFTPFGAFGDIGDTLAGQALPLASGPIMALKGLMWNGAKISSGTGVEGNDQVKNALTALGEFIDATVPVVSQAKRVGEKGVQAFNPLAATDGPKTTKDVAKLAAQITAIPVNKRTGPKYEQLLKDFQAAKLDVRRAAIEAAAKRSGVEPPRNKDGSIKVTAVRRSSRVKVPGADFDFSGGADTGRVQVPGFDFGG